MSSAEINLEKLLQQPCPEKRRCVFFLLLSLSRTFYRKKKRMKKKKKKGKKGGKNAKVSINTRGMFREKNACSFRKKCFFFLFFHRFETVLMNRKKVRRCTRKKFDLSNWLSLEVRKGYWFERRILGFLVF